ncbi:aminopeptidase (plasmid) [Legionella adelaidensis]|uniref:Aminopeptidase n=1 Tax=Legionella adelaidensis TaxID=45056 RepID=A0A0W0R0M6_9GAMM|nr:M20/M25/M40 family metallo-hydrolase [Legionella adelaidensis]KTC64589.1 aminopeptidase [Legionella adelaidensis]VEH85957.1 aminopeptidase [Legionella adelaidensis]
MNRIKIRRLLGAFFLLFSSVATSAVLSEPLKMPNCLADKLSNYMLLAKDSDYSIVDVPVEDIPKIKELAEKEHCGLFVNASTKIPEVSLSEKKAHAQAFLKNNISPKFSENNYVLLHPKEVREALSHVVPDNIWVTVSELTQFTNRSSTQNNGKNTAFWLQEKIEKMVKESGRNDVSSFFVPTLGRYIQPSLVTVIGKNNKAPAVIIGAHMDTLGSLDSVRMPGADDDASGLASSMEAARVLLSSQLEFKRPIYIVWYAAEEMGLVGSQRVVQHFKQNHLPVYAVLQLDMTGYKKDENSMDKTIWIFRDYTDLSLSNFVSKLIKNYINVPIGYSKCGYGCSDHFSWHEAGFPAAFPCETSFEDHNPYIHSASDKIDPLDLEHMTNFSKLGIAFALELALG